MANMLVSIEGVPVPRSARTKPRLLVRGKRRRVLSRAVAALKSLMTQDAGEDRRSAVYKYTPYLVLGSQNSNHMRSAVSLLARLNNALAAKA